MSAAIDAVYTWVDGSDPEFQALSQSYAQKERDLNPERFRDNLQLLKYSLRSLEKFAPWLGTVHIITSSLQRPSWLNTEHPRVRLHHHEALVPQRYLPTFNGRVLQSFLHRLPTCTDTFLYINDDFLFGNQTSAEDFLTDDGRLVLRGTLWGEQSAWCRHEKAWFSLGPIEHTPLLIRREDWAAMLERFPREVEKTRRQRFRQADGLRIDRIYRSYLVTRPPKEVLIEPAHRLLRYHRFQKLRNGLWWQRWQLAFLKWLRPKFFCLNDDFRDVPNPRVVRLVQNFLEECFPEPSSMERGAES